MNKELDRIVANSPDGLKNNPIFKELVDKVIKDKEKESRNWFSFLLIDFKFYCKMKINTNRKEKLMENAIVNESKIEKDFKQIYPNNKDVKIRIELWRDSLPLIIRGWQTRRLTIIESINERDSFFLTNAEYYTDNSVIHMYLTKDSQTQRYGISNIYITTNGNDETILLTEENSKDYKTIAKKIDKIYFNINVFSLLIVIDNDFISKQEKKLLEEKAKKEAAKNSIEDLFNKRKGESKLIILFVLLTYFNFYYIIVKMALYRKVISKWKMLYLKQMSNYKIALNKYIPITTM